MTVTPTWFMAHIRDDEGNQVSGLKSLIMNAKREHREAEQVAHSFGSSLPSRETLIDSESYWETEAEAWRGWRDGVENDWVNEGDSSANVHAGRAMESSRDRVL